MLFTGMNLTTHADRKFLISVVLNLILFTALCVTGLFALMARVDIEEQKGRLIRDADTRQQLEHQVSQARADLADAKKETENLRGRLNAQAVQDQTPDSIKPPLPIEISFRKSFWGRGLVAKFSNRSSHSLTLILAIRNPTLSRYNRFQLKVGPEDSEEFSYSEGWEFASGDELEVYHNDFKSLKVRVP
jgi:hypothetical protein